MRGQPLVAWVIRRLQPQVGAVVLSVNRNLTAYAALGRAVKDAIPGQPGPLAGIVAAARCMECEWVLTVPCDTPFLPLDLVDRLLTGARQAAVEAVYATDGRQAHYTVMLLHRGVLPDLDAFLEQGGRRVQDWLERLHAKPVVFGDDPQAFCNINTPEDLARAERLAADYLPPD